MTRTIAKCTIDAPVGEVFEAVADIGNFSKAVPQITNVEFLSDVKRGVGTRFRETRLMGGREASEELEVTEFVQDERVRIVSDSHGAVWDTVFEVTTVGGHTLLTMTMDAKPHKLLARIMTPLTKGIVKKAIEKDMAAVKEFCEAGNA